MTTPSLLKRLEAVEHIQVPSTPIMVWQRNDQTPSQRAAFEAELAARKAASPGSPVCILTWEGAP